MKLHTPSSTLTRPANTTAYAAGDLVADNTTAGSVVVPSFTAGRTGGRSYYIERIRVTTNKTSGMGSIGFTVRLWNAAPTYTNGDNGAYAVATNGDEMIGHFDISEWLQGGDGATAIAVLAEGEGCGFQLPASQKLVYWDLEISSSLTPASAQTFTIRPEIWDIGS